MLYKAILIAKLAHAGQQDKGGQPYIHHCLRVMSEFADEPLMTIAVLHDVLEDSRVMAAELSQSFSAYIVEAVVTLTRQPGEKYMVYIERVARNPLAREVKLADLKDNLDPTRAIREEYTGQAEALRMRYAVGREFLLGLTNSEG